jgi:hypothetical protein
MVITFIICFVNVETDPRLCYGPEFVGINYQH